MKPIEINVNIKNDFSTRYIEPKKSIEIPEQFLKYSKAMKLSKDIQLHKNSRYFVILDGHFIFGDLIESILTSRNWYAKKMTISTLSMSLNNIFSLQNLLKGDFIGELNLIVSDYFYSHERNGLIKDIYENLDIDNKFQLAVASTHCKICQFETENNRFIVIHGSANLRSSSNIEQIVIEENEELYRFNDDFQSRIINKYATIKKSLRRKKLWQAVLKD